MNIDEIIASLEREHERIMAALTQLRAIARAQDGSVRQRSTRGRKSMGAAERLQVSARMRRYWASRRKGQGVA